MSVDVANSLWWWMLVVWLTVLGGCVGSFLNVVIYRLPRGESLTYPGSRCPHCGHAIRWYHNVPVLGWIALRGRCHDCGAAIAYRYPLVEACVAIVFLVLAVTGPLSPEVWSFDVGTDAGPPPLRSLFAAFAWEVVLLCSVLALALIDRDISATGQGRYPLRLVAGVFVAAVVLPILVPRILVPTHAGPGAVLEAPTLRAAVRHVGFGALAGCGCGCLLFAASRGEKSSLRQSVLPALVGPYVGPWVLLQLMTAAVLVYAVPLLFLKRAKGSTPIAWRWPELFWLATFAGVVSAHDLAPALALPTNPSLPVRLAIGGALLAALVAYAIAARKRGGGAE